MNAAGGRGRLLWLTGAAAALGGGIWSMHFIALMAFDLEGTSIAYDADTTMVSLIAAIAVAGAGLYVVNRWPRRWGPLAAAGTIAGLGVAVMHYTGMAAMRVSAGISYDWLLVGASIAIAVAAATVVLFLATSLRATWHRVASAFVMGGAIASMHYTTMAAVQFSPGALPVLPALPDLPPPLLAAVVASATIIILVLGIIAALVDRRLAYRSQHNDVALQAEMEKSRTLLANIPGVCYRCVKDADYTNEFISTAVVELTGYPASDFLGNRVRSLISVCHPDDLHLLVKAINEGIDQRRPFTVEYRIVRKDGSIRWVHERGQPAFSDKGTATHLDGFIFDITEQRQIENELRTSEQKFKTLLGNIPGAVYRSPWEALDTMEFISDAIEEICGYPADELIRNRVRTYASIIHPDDWPMVEASIGEALVQRRPLSIEYRIIHRHGSHRWLI
jgi:PAS domain S-box-containing protein